MQAQRFVERDVFLTPRLWGVGSTAPYGHRGDFRMLDEVIAAHGGEARFARDAYLALDKSRRDDGDRVPALAGYRGAVMTRTPPTIKTALTVVAPRLRRVARPCRRSRA